MQNIPIRKDLPRETTSDVLWVKYDVHTMPLRFNVVLRHKSQNQCDDSYIKEWRIVGNSEIETRCICSHDIMNTYILENIHNYLKIEVGSCCIKKFMTHLNDDLKFLESQRVYEKSGSGKFRQCLSCGSYRVGINNPDWKDRCKKCFTQNNPIKFVRPSDEPTRECQKCKKLNIPQSEPEWKKVCRVCYLNNNISANEDQCKNCKSNINNNQQYCSICITNRECQDCKIKKIGLNEPSYKKRCLECYRKYNS